MNPGSRMNNGDKVKFEWFGKKLTGHIVEVLHPGQIPACPSGNVHFYGAPVVSESCVVQVGDHFYLVRPIEFL